MRAYTIVAAVILAVMYVHAQTPKSKFDSKAKSLGIAFLTVGEIGKFTDCIDDEFYKEASMDKIADQCIPCALNCVPMSKYTTLMGMMGKMDKCMEKEKQTTMKLIDKIMAPAKTVLAKAYDAIITDVKKAKKNGKAKPAVLDKGYTTASAVVTKALIQQLCKKLYEKITKLEWDCFKQHADALVTFKNYNCSTWEKKK